MLEYGVCRWAWLGVLFGLRKEKISFKLFRMMRSEYKKNNNNNTYINNLMIVCFRIRSVNTLEMRGFYARRSQTIFYKGISRRGGSGWRWKWGEKITNWFIRIIFNIKWCFDYYWHSIDETDRVRIEEHRSGRTVYAQQLIVLSYCWGRFCNKLGEL